MGCPPPAQRPLAAAAAAPVSSGTGSVSQGAVRSPGPTSMPIGFTEPRPGSARRDSGPAENRKLRNAKFSITQELTVFEHRMDGSFHEKYEPVRLIVSGMGVDREGICVASHCMLDSAANTLDSGWMYRSKGSDRGHMEAYIWRRGGMELVDTLS